MEILIVVALLLGVLVGLPWALAILFDDPPNARGYDR
jgi:4-amino-4-deoxy-L-arabinose transferase-like glycosyltransferase